MNVQKNETFLGRKDKVFSVSEVMTRHVHSITVDTSIPKALALMSQEHVKELPVVEGDHVIGLLTMHSITSNVRDVKGLKVSKLMIKPPVLSSVDDLLVAVQLMSETGIHGLPVTSGESIVGFVSDYDLLKAFKDQFKGLSVNELMIHLPKALKPSDSVSRAKKLFFNEKVSSLPVIDKSGSLVSVLTESDLIDFYQPHESMGRSVEGAGESHKALKAPIKGVLPRVYHTVELGSPLTKALNLMIEYHLSSIVIVSEGKPFSFLKRFDLINYLYHQLVPDEVLVEFNGLELDFPTSNLLSKVVRDHLTRVNYLTKSINKIGIRIKPLHKGEGVRKVELYLRVYLDSKVTQRVKKVGYELREVLDEALTDVEKIMKKAYKKK